MIRMGSFGTDDSFRAIDAPVKYASLLTDMPQLNNGKNRFHGVKISLGKDD